MGHRDKQPIRDLPGSVVAQPPANGGDEIGIHRDLEPGSGGRGSDAGCPHPRLRRRHVISRVCGQRCLVALLAVFLMVVVPLPHRSLGVKSAAALVSPKVGIVGDSITASSTPQLRLSFGSNPVSINAVPGIGMQPGRGLTMVQTMVATKPDLLVIELGINNLADGWGADDVADMDRILVAARPVPTVLWVVPTSLAPCYYDGPSGTTLRQRIVAFRLALLSHAARYRNVRVADFGLPEDAHHEWLGPDRLHLSPQGTEAYAQFMYELRGASGGPGSSPRHTN